MSSAGRGSTVDNATAALNPDSAQSTFRKRHRGVKVVQHGVIRWQLGNNSHAMEDTGAAVTKTALQGIQRDWATAALPPVRIHKLRRR